MNKKYIIALDQGTTSSRALIFDKNNNIYKTISDFVNNNTLPYIC
jgi:glycerol kinase